MQHAKRPNAKVEVSKQTHRPVDWLNDVTLHADSLFDDLSDKDNRVE